MTEGIERATKRRFAYLCAAVSLAVVIGFTAVDLLEGDTAEAVANIAAGLVLGAGVVGVAVYGADLLVYRASLALLSATFLYEVAIGSGEGTVLFWLFVFPPVFMFLLGKGEGLWAYGVFWGLLLFLILDPFGLGTYGYDGGVGVRVLVSLLFVAAVSYGLEASREQYGRLVMENSRQLLEEKENLEQARSRIRTLSGLIPICSYCKNIRDDTGYWQQVEMYVRERSEAEFSHGICPECLEKIETGERS